jgi:hypothetical protein
MGIREWLNRNQAVATVVVLVLVLAAVGLAGYQYFSNRRTISTKLPDAYFTIDDGKTYFTASTSNVPPFDHEGKPAVRAYVFDCNGKKFVGYLERYKPDARQAKLDKKATPATQIYGRELKRPGETTWVNSGDQAAVAKVIEVPTPPGMSGEPQPIEP